MQNRLQEILFRHYFTDGLYPDVANLVQAGAEAGLAAADCESYLSSNEADFTKTILSADATAKRNGVHGVPYFYFNNADFKLSGAQDPSTFLQAFEQC